MTFSRMKLNLAAMLASMVLGIAIAACVGGTPDPVMSAPEETAPTQKTVSTLQTVMDRGHLICIGNPSAPGFSVRQADGSFTGFDTDFCRAVAAAVFGDAEKFEIKPATVSERFAMLAAGEADVLIRNTTNTMSRDTDLGGNFAPTTFYDGQGVMVRAADGIHSLEDLEGRSVCVAAGTTAEFNLADVMAARGIGYTPVVVDTNDEIITAYAEGRCDATTTDKSGLVGRRAGLPDPAGHIILDETLSKVPLGPMVRHGDDQWYDLVKWVVNVTFLAEELGVTSANADAMKDNSDPNIQRLLGVTGEFGSFIGVSNDWAYNVIAQVGNYGEIYERHLGPGTSHHIPRGLNNSWVNGGLLYSPPIR